MKSNGLLTFLTLSVIRRNILLELFQKPMTFNELKETLGMTSPQIIPYIRELQGKNLIQKEQNEYRLTPIGKVVVKKLKPLIESFKSLDSNDRFLSSHDLKLIPEHLVERIDELGECVIIENSLENITATYREVLAKLSASAWINGISSIFEIEYPKFFLALAQHERPVSLILTKKIYSKLEKEYASEINQFLSCKESHLYVMDDAPIAFAVTDNFLSLSLCSTNGYFDALTNLMSFEKPALKWGEELFQYYKEKSVEIVRQ
jgi:predicted transcriptional regulator